MEPEVCSLVLLWALQSTSSPTGRVQFDGRATWSLIGRRALCVCRSVPAVTAEASECSTPTGWARTPPTSSSRWSWSTPSTRPSDATPTPSGSQRRCTSTGRCAAWPLQERRAAAWARATSSTWPSAAPAAPPGRGATPCSCTAIVRGRERSVHSRNKHPFYGDTLDSLLFCVSK